MCKPIAKGKKTPAWHASSLNVSKRPYGRPSASVGPIPDSPCICPLAPTPTRFFSNPSCAATVVTESDVQLAQELQAELNAATAVTLPAIVDEETLAQQQWLLAQLQQP
jgi:hypothetical protein